MKFCACERSLKAHVDSIKLDDSIAKLKFLQLCKKCLSPASLPQNMLLGEPVQLQLGHSGTDKLSSSDRLLSHNCSIRRILDSFFYVLWSFNRSDANVTEYSLENVSSKDIPLPLLVYPV